MDDAGDLQVEFAGQRMCWWAVSERGRAWVAAHADSLELAPEGVECLVQYGDPVLWQALEGGLVVMSGDLEVSLC